jgi:predicted dehydrogenase
LGDAPIPQVITSPRDPRGPIVREFPVDATLLEAGDHNGSTFYQHEGFLALVRGERSAPDVSVDDGWKAVAMGMAAQESARTGQAQKIAF